MAEAAGHAQEGRVRISLKEGVFYNPEMELCRDLSSLFVGAAGGKLSVVDAMCASGIRGLRYKKENPNVGQLALVDTSSRAVQLARKNARANRVRCSACRADACEYLRRHEFDFVELDPFGSPAPYLFDAARSFAAKKGGYLSATATDMAVLCGAHHAACLKNYGSAPLDNEFCHENACRILAGKVALTFAQFSIAARPAFTLSHRHYVKMIFALEKGAEAASGCVKGLGYVSYCPGCCWRGLKRLVLSGRCPECGHKLEHGGPLWAGSLWREEKLKRMLSLNAERGYGKAAQAEKMLAAMLSECNIGTAAYYDLHALAKKHKTRILGMDDALCALREAGFACSRTHFSPTSIRTDAPHSEVVRLVSK